MKHKRLKKLLVSILCVCLMMTMMPATAFATGNTETTVETVVEEPVASDALSSDDEYFEHKDASEVTEEDVLLDESGEGYTTFSLGGDRRLTIFFTEDVRYENEDGELIDYDPSLVEMEAAPASIDAPEGYVYENAAGDNKLYIPESLSEDTPILMEKDDYAITMVPTDKTYKDFFGKTVKIKTGKGKVKDALDREHEKTVKASYKDETALAYIEYTSKNTGIKEDIVFTARPAKNVLDFEVTAKGTYPVLSSEDGSIGFYDKNTDELVGMIEPPNMNDATGEAYSEDLYYSITEKDGEEDAYILTLTIDKDYLKDKERVYPVTIDPATSWVGDSSLRDVYVSSASPDSNYYTTARTTMPVGKGSSSTYRTYIHFYNLKSSVKGNIVDTAYLNIYENSDSNSGKLLKVHRVTGSWTASGITWNEQPGYDSTAIDSLTTTGTDKYECYFDLLSFVRDVADEEVSNYGVVIKKSSESTTGYAEFYGARSSSTSYRPNLYVEYTYSTAVPNLWFSDNTLTESGQALVYSYNNFAYCVEDVEYVIKDADGNIMNTSGDYESLGTDDSPAASGFSIPLTATLPDGSYTMSVRGSYYNGLVAESVDVPFYVDRNAPTITSFTLTETADGSVIVGWDVDDAFLTSVVVKVNGQTLKTSTLASSSYTINSSYLLEDEENTIQLIATDDYSRSTTSTKYFSYDSAAPVIGRMYVDDDDNTASGGWYNVSHPMIIMTGVSDDVTTIGTEHITYAIAALSDGSPSDSDYEVPTICVVNGSVVVFYVDETLTSSGIYRIYARVTDDKGNSVTRSIYYYFDNEAPTGQIQVKDRITNEDLTEIDGVVMITGTADSDSGSIVVGNKMELLQNTDGGLETVRTIYDNSAGSATGSASAEFNAAGLTNGSYILRMTLTDKAGNSREITQNITIANRIDKPVLSAASTKNGQTTVTYTLPENITSISKIQYSVGDTDDLTWTDVNTTALSGSFTVQLPDTEGKYKVNVRAVDEDGLAGEEQTVNVRVDKTVPTAILSNVSQGIIRGTADDEEFAKWTVYVKEKDSTSATWQTVLEGSKSVDNSLFGNINLSDESFTTDTWYTVKLAVEDVAGNLTEVTADIYKDSSYPSATIVEPSFRIVRPTYQSYNVPQIVFDESVSSIELDDTTALDNIVWYVNNVKVAENQESLALVDAEGNSVYTSDVQRDILVTAEDSSGITHYSNTLMQNAEVKEAVFTSSNEYSLSFDDAVGFTVFGESESTTYSVKVGSGEYIEITAGTTVNFRTLSSGVTASSMTLKAENADGSTPEAVLVGFHQIENETFEISGIENYRPSLLSASDKINYKTYLKWDIPDTIPSDISYEVYRSTEHGFNPELLDPIAETQTGYYVEPNADYETTFYYRVRAVKKDDSGNVIARSSFSDQVTSTVVDEDEFLKRLGYKSYWNYANFTLPMGSGYIEKSDGNFMYEETDAEIANEKLDTSITRVYNSKASSKSAFGLGWNHNYDIELLTTDYSERLEEGKRIVLKDASGTMFYFLADANENGEYISSMGAYLRLTKLSGTDTTLTYTLPGTSTDTTKTIDVAYKVVTTDNLTYWFNAGGQLVFVNEPNGNFMVMTHDVQTGLLTKVTTSKNISIQFIYNTDVGTDPTTVKEILMPDGSKTSYTYNSTSGRLSCVTHVGSNGTDGVSYAYTYDSDGNLSVIEDGADNQYKVFYLEDEDKVSFAVYPDTQKLVFAYNNNVTTTTAKYGDTVMSTETATFDATSGNCLQVVNDTGLITTYTYVDGMLDTTTTQVAYQIVVDGSIQQAIDTHTSTTNYTALKTAETIESGFEEWVELVEYEYANADEYLATLPTNEKGTIDGEVVYDTDYTYDSNGNLLYEFDDISQLGFEYVYYIEDLVTYAARSSEENTPVTFSASTSSYNTGEIQSVTAKENNVTQSVTTYTYSYDSSGNKTIVETTTAGDVTTVNTTVYDVMGRLLSSTTSVNNTVTTSISCTYDAFGRMTGQVTTEGAVVTEVTNTYNTSGTVNTQTTKITEGSEVTTSTTTYVYDLMNRVTSQTTVTGEHSRPTVTTYSYGQVEIDPLRGNSEMGYAQITTTTAGNQTSVSYTNGRGEVIKTVEAGVTTWYAYDKSGRKIASAVTGSGETLANAVITASAYDKNGNLIYTISDCTYNGTTDSFVSTSDSIITSATYDAQGRTVTETDAKGVVTAYTYDTQGRTKTITQDVNGLGYVTEITYTGPSSASNTTTTDIELANGTISREVIDVNGNTTLEATIGGEQSIAKTYTYTANGNVVLIYN